MYYANNTRTHTRCRAESTPASREPHTRIVPERRQVADVSLACVPCAPLELSPAPCLVRMRFGSAPSPRPPRLREQPMDPVLPVSVRHAQHQVGARPAVFQIEDPSGSSPMVRASEASRPPPPPNLHPPRTQGSHLSREGNFVKLPALLLPCCVRDARLRRAHKLYCSECLLHSISGRCRQSDCPGRFIGIAR